MKLFVAYISFMSSVAVLVAGNERSQTLQTAVSMPECLRNIDRYTCTTNHAQGLVDIVLQCGPDRIQFAENQAAQCSTNEEGVYCFATLSTLNTTRARVCSSLEIGNNSSACTSACLEFLQDTVEISGCCVDTVFNTRFSLLVLGFDIQVAFNVCNVQLPRACVSPINIMIPPTTDMCTFQQFWGRVVNYLCTASVGQPYVDAIVATDPACTPIARHYASFCGRANGRYCLDILQGSFPLAHPTQNAFVNPYLKNVTSECAIPLNTCSTSCKTALQTAIREFGCCINMFNDTVNQVLLPHISGRVMTACGLDSPGYCTSVLSVGRAGKVKASIVWILLCMALLSVLVSQL